MQELLEKRTANSKTFDLSKGKRWLVISVGATHSKDNYRHILATDKFPFQAVFRDTGLIREARGKIMIDPTINLQVAASSDDASEKASDGSVNLTSNLPLNSTATATNRYWVGARFLSSSLPSKGSIIDACYAQFYNHDIVSNDIDGYFYFEKQASPATFAASANDISGRALTDAFISWAQDFDGTAWRTSPSLKEVLQEVVDSYSPTALVLIFKPRSDVEKKFATRPWDYNDHTLAPKLVISYTSPAKATWAYHEAEQRMRKTSFYPNLKLG